MSKASAPAPASNKVPASTKAPASAPTGSKTNTASTVAGGKRAAGSTVGPAASGTDFATVKDVYTKIWRVTPYTSFVMFDYLLKKSPAGASPLKYWDSFLASQEPSLADFKMKTVAAPTDNDQVLWNGQSGLCTSFAIRVATEARVAEIQYGNQKKTFRGKEANVHRAGWEISGTSAIVIDSSARQAINFENTNQPVRLQEAQWAFQGEILSHTAKGVTAPFAPCLPKGPEGWKAAMQICLEQLLPKNDIILMFRSVKGSKVGFAGTVIWDFKNHTCTFSTLKDKDVSVVTFAGTQAAGPAAASGAHTAGPAVAQGAPPAAEPDTAFQLFWDWINQSKVPSRKSQFSRELQGIHSQIWQAAVTSWGTPTLKYSSGIEPTKGSASSAPGAAGAGAAAGAAKSSNAKAPVDMKTAPGTQPVPGGLAGSVGKVALNALMNVKQ